MTVKAGLDTWLGLAPVLCFLGALVLLDSYKLVRLRAVVAAVVAGMVIAGIAYLLNGWLLQWFEFHVYTRYVSPVLEEALKALAREITGGTFQIVGKSVFKEEFVTAGGVALDEVDVHVERRDGAPAMLVRAGDERDLPALAAMHASRSSNVRFALRRDPPVIDHALSKKRLLAGFGHGAGPRAERQTEFFVAEEGVSAVAYVVLTVSAGGWTLEEAGDRDPAGARLGAILQALLAREPSRPAPLIRAWWPPALPAPPQVRLVNRIPARDIFMLRPIAKVGIPKRADEVFYWRSDYF